MAGQPMGSNAGTITKGQRRATDIGTKRKVPQALGTVKVTKGK